VENSGTTGSEFVKLEEKEWRMVWK
jgi:hypothetical protein